MNLCALAAASQSTRPRGSDGSSGCRLTMHFPSKATDLIWPVVSEKRNCTSPPRGLHEWACRRSDNPRPIVSMHHPRPSTSSRLSARKMTGGGVRRSGGAALAAVAATSNIAAADANSCKRCMCPSITFMISVLNLYARGRIVRRKMCFWAGGILVRGTRQKVRRGSLHQR